MTVARFAISFDQALAKQVRKAAGKEPTSSWLADAARRKLRAEGLGDRAPNHMSTIPLGLAASKYMTASNRRWIELVASGLASVPKTAS